MKLPIDRIADFDGENEWKIWPLESDPKEIDY
jgi:hypothetical protein